MEDVDDPDVASLQAYKQVPITVLLGPTGPLLRKLHVLTAPGQSLAPDLVDEIYRVQDGVKKLCLPLKNMSEEEEVSVMVRWWMKLVRELCYDMEDCVDDVGSGPSAHLNFSDLLARAKVASKRRKLFEWSPTPMAAKPADEGEAGVISLRSSKLPVPVGGGTKAGVVELPKKLVELLALDNDNNQTLKVIPITGCAGVGKTTIARALYHRHGGKFQCRAFVTVSPNPDMRGFLTSMLSQLKAPPPHGFPDVPDLVDAISIHLQGKRYFIVIDDLWTALVWNIISSAFPTGDYWSRIIITTEIDDVARACCNYDSANIYKMEPLNDNESGKLFFRGVFGSEDGCPTCTKKCGGLPLEIVNVTSLLASKSNIIMDNLKHMQGMQDVLNRIFNSLPPCLQTCLLYLSMYPQGYVVKKDELVKLWVAEGFLLDGGDTEEIAVGYFDELVNRGLVQAVDTNNRGEVLSCTVHQIVLDFIRYKSKEENFVITVDYSQSTLALRDKVRRLSVQFGGVKSAHIPENIKAPQVRSLVFWGFIDCVPSIINCGFLRVLVLHLWADRDKKSFDLTSIRELSRMKYIAEHSEEHINKHEERRYARTGLVSMKHHAPSVNVVTGAFGSLLPKLLELLKYEYNLEAEVKGKVKSLHKELEALQAPLREVAELEKDSEPDANQRDEVLNAWARDVRDLSYDAEDIIDSLSARIEGSDPDIELKADIESLIPRTSALLSREKDRHENSNAIGDSNVFMGEVIEMLRHETSDVSKMLKIVSIVGMGGLGKTILAKAVYAKIQAQYDCTAFVSVSRDPNMMNVYKDILYQIDKHTNPNLADLSENELIKEVMKRLTNKRYLIVVDDIRDMESWKRIKSALIYLKCGSNVVITTRIINIAEKVGDVYKLKALSHQDSKALFNKRLLCGKEEVRSGDPEVPDKLLSKCGGVPLAIITMASMLVGKTMDDWSNVYNNIGFGSEVGGNTNVANARKIKETLIWKWAAEGLVVERPEIGLFEIGEEYLKVLINKNMVLPVEDDTHPGKVTGCRVEDSVFEMICYLSTQENFATIIDDSKQYFPVESKARRLSVQKWGEEQGDPLADIGPETPRSFNTMGCHFSKVSLSRFQLLRVLSLEECRLVEGNLSHLGKLLLLRYLGLSGTPIDKLPEEIGDLIYLQTLDMRRTGVYYKLPGRVAELRQLKCLRTDESTSVPDWIGDITSLEELRMGKVSMSKNFVNELGRLTELRELEIWIEGLGKNQNNALAHFMKKLKKIQVLRLMGGSSSRGEPKWGDFIPPENLLELHLITPSYGLPAWINVSRVPMLSHLCVNVKAVEEEDLDILGGLPKLISLVMWLPSSIYLRIKGGLAFPELRCFHISAPFRFEAGAMRRLESLYIKIDGIADVKLVATTLVNLRSIQKVEVQISSTGDVENMREAVKGEVDEHRNHPSLRVVKTYR